MSRYTKLFSAVVLLVVAALVYGTIQTPKVLAQTDAKAIAQMWADAANATIKAGGDTTAYAAIVTADYTEESAPEGTTGIDYVKQAVTSIATAFPDGKYEVTDAIVEGDKVWVRATFTGTNTGSLSGLPATNKPITLKGVEFLTVKDGKIASHGSLTDSSVLYSQLGFTITPPTAEAAATPAQ